MLPRLPRSGIHKISRLGIIFKDGGRSRESLFLIVIRNCPVSVIKPHLILTPLGLVRVDLRGVVIEAELEQHVQKNHLSLTHYSFFHVCD